MLIYVVFNAHSFFARLSRHSLFHIRHFLKSDTSVLKTHRALLRRRHRLTVRLTKRRYCGCNMKKVIGFATLFKNGRRVITWLPIAEVNLRLSGYTTKMMFQIRSGRKQKHRTMETTVSIRVIDLLGTDFAPVFWRMLILSTCGLTLNVTAFPDGRLRPATSWLSSSRLSEPTPGNSSSFISVSLLSDSIADTQESVVTVPDVFSIMTVWLLSLETLAFESPQLSLISILDCVTFDPRSLLDRHFFVGLCCQTL